MIENQEKPTLQERYIRATRSNDLHLSLRPDAPRTDADLLLAAGFASAGNSRAMLALDFYRLGKTGDLANFRQLSDVAGRWLCGRSRRGGRRKMSLIQARDLASRVLFWWRDKTCKVCSGRRHPVRPDSARLDYSRDCPACHGTGEYPVHRIVPPGTADEARWLVDEIDQLCMVVFREMAKRTARTLDLSLKP